MSPEKGRFSSRDTFDGNDEDPSTLHKYAFGNSDPVLRIDPTGISAEDSISNAELATPFHLYDASVEVAHSGRDSFGNRLKAYVQSAQVADVTSPWPGVKVTVTGGMSVDIKLPLNFVWEGPADWRREAEVTGGMRRVWNGMFFPYLVHFQITAGPNPITATLSQSCGEPYTMYGETRLYLGNPSSFFCPYASPNVYGHEAGHMMGLPDRYYNTMRDGHIVSVPFSGFEHNIMGDSLYGHVDPEDIEDILHMYVYGPTGPGY